MSIPIEVVPYKENNAAAQGFLKNFLKGIQDVWKQGPMPGSSQNPMDSSGTQLQIDPKTGEYVHPYHLEKEEEFKNQFGQFGPFGY